MMEGGLILLIYLGIPVVLILIAFALMFVRDAQKRRKASLGSDEPPSEYK